MCLAQTSRSFDPEIAHQEFGNQDAILNAGVDFNDIDSRTTSSICCVSGGCSRAIRWLYPFNQPDNPGSPGIPVAVAPWEWTSFAGNNPNDPCNQNGDAARMYIDSIIRFTAPRMFLCSVWMIVLPIIRLDIIPNAEIGLNTYPNSSSDLSCSPQTRCISNTEIKLYDQNGRPRQVNSESTNPLTHCKREASNPDVMLPLFSFKRGTCSSQADL